MATVSVTCLEESIFQVNLNDSKNENRISNELINEFMEVLSYLATEPTLKVLILTGRQDVFCAGASLEMLRQISSENTYLKDLSLLSEILHFPVPIIGALQGHAVGGGLILALYCDIIVAAENCRYGVNFTSMGFTPGMGTTSILPILVGHHFASEMILTARFYKGRELEKRGLFNYVVPSEKVKDVALDIARRIAEKPRYVIEMVKATLSLPRHQALQQAVSQERLMHKICFNHPETRAMIEAIYLN